MTEPLLSIIVPVYNAEQFLPALLGGLLSAAHMETEILLIDDGSVDKSLSICRRFEAEDARVRVFCQKNSGPSTARNLGIRESRGRYVAFFDADDVIDIAALDRSLSLLEQYDAEVWASDYTRIALNGCTLDIIRQIEERPVPILGRGYLPQFLSDHEQVWNIWRFLFRRDFLLAHKLFFLEGYNCAEDLEYMVRVLKLVERPAFYHNPYYHYRAHYGNTLTRRYTLKRVEDLSTMLLRADEHLSGCREQYARLLRDKLVREYIRNLSLLHEVSREDFTAALTAYSRASVLLRRAYSPELKLVCVPLRVLGPEKASRLILGLKQVKRAFRRKKIEGYEKKCQSESQ